MSNACNICAQVRNSNGDMVDSRLFKDLLHYTSNDRDLTKRLYKIGTSSEFLNAAGSKIETDENGEVTLKTLLKATDTTLKQESVIAACNKDITGNKEGASYGFQEAVERLQNFNRNHAFKEGYMATIKRNKDNTYYLHVVKRSNSNEDKLNKVISNEGVQNRIIATLARHGVSVTFLQEAGENSTFSTENAERNANNLLNLIKIAKGEKIQEDLAEEAGHMAIAALSDTPLVKRLINALDQPAQRALLGEEYDRKYLGRDARREVAGDIVGRALNNGIDKKSPLSRLIRRVCDYIAKKFYKITGDTVKINKIEAYQLADKIARGFMSANAFTSDDTILAKEETLYSAEYNPKVTAYKTMVNQIKSIANELRAADSKLASVFEAIANQVEAGRSSIIAEDLEVYANAAALSGIAEAVDLILQVMSNDIGPLLESVDFDDSRDFAYNMARNGSSLRQAHIAYKGCLEVLQGINLVRNFLGSQEELSRIQLADPETGRLISKDLNQLCTTLASFVGEIPGSFFETLKNKEYQFFLKFLENSYGSKFIERGAKVLFKWDNWKKRHKHIVVFEKGGQKSIDDLLRNLEHESNWFNYNLASMSNNVDIIGQIVDKVTKQANKNADDITNQVWDTLKELKYEMENDLGIKDSSYFYERDADGKLTGSFISSVHWGTWEDTYKKFMADEKEHFKELHRLEDGGYDYDNLSDFEKALLWDQYFCDKAKKWHKKHSVWDNDEGRYRPSNTTEGGKISYSNPEFDKLSTKEREFLGKIMDIKVQLDALTGDAMPNHRVPQFKGTFINRVRNRGSVLNPALYGKGIWESVKETFCMDSEDTDYGSENTYNLPEEDLFEDDIAFEQEKLNRLTTFGVNKLKDMDQLSTDIFHSMLAYAGMATHYHAMSQVVDTMEVGKYVLNERNLKRTARSEKNNESNKTYAYNRYLKFLDKQVYNISQKNPKIGWKNVCLNKIAAFLSGLASKLYLGGNVLGGLVNLGTGIIEIAKEAGSGEFFDLKDWKDANLIYWKSLPKNLWQTGRSSHEDKVNLFCRHFNVMGLNRFHQKEWFTRKSRMARFFYGECLLMPYSAGDHYMQSMSYLAMAKGKKLIDADGDRISMWDAYKVKSLENKAGKTLVLDGTYFETDEDRMEYDLIQEIIRRLRDGIFLGDIQEDYLERNKITLDNIDDAIALLELRAHDKTWNEDKESAFMDRAREINDRLHGIYNDQDKTAFHQSIHTNMLLAMRGYALGMVQRRFGEQKYSIALGGEAEGTLRTLAKVVAATATDEWGWGKAIRAIFLPNKKTQDMMLKAGFNINQYRNMRRNFGDYLFIAALYLLYLLTEKSDDDDDKELEEYYAKLREDYGYTTEEIKAIKKEDEEAKESHLVGIIHYFTVRLLREQVAYNSHVGMEDEYKNITSLTPAGISILTDLYSFSKNLGGAMIYDYVPYDPAYYDSLKDYGYTNEEIKEMKAQARQRQKEASGQQYFYKKSGGTYEKGDPKYLRKLKSMLPYYRSMMILKDPYQAIESYKFGRRQK